MRDVREVMRELMANLAPKDHRGLDADALVRIGYKPHTAEHLVKAWQEQDARGGHC